MNNHRLHRYPNSDYTDNINLCNHFFQRGATLIEAMLALLIMLILVVGGTAFLFYSSARVSRERNRRVALEVANSRLEEMRAADYNAITPLTQDYNTYFIDNQSGIWEVSANDPGATVNINGLNMPITTTVQYVDDPHDGPTNSYDYLLAIVRVSYRLNSAERVSLVTYIAP